MKLANLSGKTIAIMVASGFDETGFISIQRAMMQAGAKLRIISREAGLTNAWNGSGWGMSYPVDSTLSTTLAVDYDALIVPSGERHITTLSDEVHAKRILRAFLREDMPVLLIDDAIRILDIVEMAHPEFAADETTTREGNLVVAKQDAVLSGLEMLNGVLLDYQDESRAA